ncbi:MAG: hypothetical protein ACRCZI_02845 [Cetobacterium sp.]
MVDQSEEPASMVTKMGNFSITEIDEEKYLNYLIQKNETRKKTQNAESNLCNYTENLKQELIGSNLDNFWIIIPDEVINFDKTDFDNSIKILTNTFEKSEKIKFTREQLQSCINQQPAKFAGKYVALFVTDPFQRSKYITRDIYYRDRDTWISSKVIVHKLACDNPNLNTAKFSGIHCIWKSTDFNISRFSLNLIFHITVIYIRNGINCWCICGSPLKNILELMRNKCDDAKYISFIENLLVPIDSEHM